MSSVNQLSTTPKTSKRSAADANLDSGADKDCNGATQHRSKRPKCFRQLSIAKYKAEARQNNAFPFFAFPGELKNTVYRNLWDSADHHSFKHRGLVFEARKEVQTNGPYRNTDKELSCWTAASNTMRQENIGWRKGWDTIVFSDDGPVSPEIGTGPPSNFFDLSTAHSLTLYLGKMDLNWTRRR